MNPHHTDVYRKGHPDPISRQFSIFPSEYDYGNQSPHKDLNPDKREIAMLHQAGHQLITFGRNTGPHPDDRKDRIKKVEREK